MKSLRSTPVQAVSSKYCFEAVRGVTAHFYNLCANGKSCVVNDKSIKGLLSLTDGGAPNLCASCTAATVPYWNKLPSDVKNCSTVLSFKVRLEGFKKEMISKNSVNDFYFWNVSNEVLGKIEGPSYLSNKETHNEYLWFHPFVAKKRFVNLYSTGKYK